MKRFSALGQLSVWENRVLLISSLAERLKNNCLSLVLGAGVSQAFRLPNWGELIKNMETECGYTCKDADLFEKADELRNFLMKKNGYTHYLDVVQKCLYNEVNDDFEVLNDRKVLDAIAALCIPSSRGSIREIITFNFDNILEIYLKYYGIIAYSPISGNSWRANADVNIYHIHGLLPKNTKSERSPSIVFDTTSYKERAEFEKWEWAPKISSLLRSTTAIFIGLSGDDENMKSFITDSEINHAYNNTTDTFWGVTFVRNKKDEKIMEKMTEKWLRWKIFPIVIKSTTGADECTYQELENAIKTFLFAISQAAAGL